MVFLSGQTEPYLSFYFVYNAISVRTYLPTNPFTPCERKAVFSLAGIYFLRMFGVFMILPVLSLYAEGLSGATPFVIGLALGIYGFTQAVFQVPFGMLSDRYNRKYIIAMGLIIFGIGSVVAALADSMAGLVAGRAIQGAGAISAAVLALNADLTRNDQRTKSMAIIGISIGVAFMASLILAPVIQGYIGVPGLFWMVAVLSVSAVFVLAKVVPDAEPADRQIGAGLSAGQFRRLLGNPQLLQLNLGILILHLVLTALFLLLPTLFREKSGFELSGHWKLYLVVLGVSVAGMAPFVMAGSKERWLKSTYRAAIGVLLMATCGMFFAHHSTLFAVMVAAALFFSAFNALESLLPSIVSQVAPRNQRGAAMGIYNTFQFSGIFLGGAGGGWLNGQYGHAGVLVFCVLAITAWLGSTIALGGLRGTVTEE